MTARRHRQYILLILFGLIILAALWFFMIIHPIRHPTSPSLSDQSTSTQTSCIAKLPDNLKLAQKIMVAGYADTLSSQINLFSTFSIGGVILMNEIPATSVRSFTDAQSIPPFVATDQEGGTVQRYKSEGVLPGALDMTNFTPQQAYSQYLADDQYLKSIGITTNFAPVVDVAYAGYDPLPGRIYSSDPSIVVTYAEQAIRASQSADITPVIKHFPGLGSTAESTDFGPASTADFASLEAKDLIPYHQLSGLHPDVMVSNAIVPGLTDGQPASLSRQAITATLRDKYGYQDAVVYTDSLAAKAITISIPDAAVLAWEAGADMALIVQLPDQTSDLESSYIKPILQAGENALHSGKLSHSELNASIGRIFARKHVDACKV